MAVAISPNGNRVYISDVTDHTISVIDTTTNTVIDTITAGNGATFMAAHGDRLYVSNTFDDTVSVIDTTTNTVIETVKVGDLPSG